MDGNNDDMELACGSTLTGPSSGEGIIKVVVSGEHVVSGGELGRDIGLFKALRRGTPDIVVVSKILV